MKTIGIITVCLILFTAVQIAYDKFTPKNEPVIIEKFDYSVIDSLIKSSKYNLDTLSSIQENTFQTVNRYVNNINNIILVSDSVEIIRNSDSLLLSLRKISSYDPEN